MKIIVGLGNHPPKYAQTRHNFGFLCTDQLQKNHHLSSWLINPRFKAKLSFGDLGGAKVILVQPQTLMNLSGQSVAALCQFYKVKPADILVISDDLDQDFGNQRFREKGSDGGQRGLRNIIQLLGTDAFPRLKLGIDNDQRTKIPTENFVLMKFTDEETKQLPHILNTAEKKILDWIKNT